MNKKRDYFFLVGLCAISMVFLIHIGTGLFANFKIDFTEEKIYTLTSGTKSILEKMNKPVSLKLYYSKTAANRGTEGIRAFNNYFKYVRNLLEEYVENSRNNLKLEIIDPRPDTKEEEDAIYYGLKKFHLTESEKYFFGLIIENTSGVEKVIEFFDPNQKDKLEYQISKLIYSVNRPQKKRVGILSSLEVMAGDLNPYLIQMMKMQGKNPQDTWVIAKVMEELFKIKKIEKDVKKIRGVDILMVIHPKELSLETQFAIDQFVLKGGKLLLFVDPVAVVDNQPPPLWVDMLHLQDHLT